MIFVSQVLCHFEGGRLQGHMDREGHPPCAHERVRQRRRLSDQLWRCKTEGGQRNREHPGGILINNKIYYFLKKTHYIPGEESDVQVPLPVPPKL